jgi:excisionase family DNA binding protein
MASITLDPDDLERLADLVAERIMARFEVVDATEDRWMTSAEAATYLGMTRNALDKLCAARTVPFEQDVRGGKRWFKSADLDAWRRGEKP